MGHIIMAKRKNTRQQKNTEQPVKKPSGFCYWDGDVLVLNILGTPSAKRDVIGKPKGNQLKVSVTAAPRRGKATDHMVAFLSKQFGVKNADIEVVFGRMNINKQLRIHSPQSLPSVITRFLQKKEKQANPG